jgi:hypothetical protein
VGDGLEIDLARIRQVGAEFLNRKRLAGCRQQRG